MLHIAITLLLTWHPPFAARVAAMINGRPDIVPALVGICWRESRCRPIGVHDIDAHLSARGWWGQRRLGHIDPSCQPYGRGGWGTRGAWGLSAASHWSYLPRCYRPEIFDVPLVSALVAARKYVRACEPRARSKWCVSAAGRRAASRARTGA